MKIVFRNQTDREIASYLYERFAAGLRQYARNCWKMDEDETMELLYDTIYGFIENYSSQPFASENKVNKLLWTIFRNKLRDRYRRKKRNDEIALETSFDENNPEHQGKVAVDPSVSADIMMSPDDDRNNPLLVELEKILSGLEDWQRQLLICRAHGIAYSTIAQLTKEDEKNLKVYYGRLKKRLKKQLAEFLSPSEPARRKT